MVDYYRFFLAMLPIIDVNTEQELSTRLYFSAAKDSHRLGVIVLMQTQVRSYFSLFMGPIKQNLRTIAMQVPHIRLRSNWPISFVQHIFNFSLI